MRSNVSHGTKGKQPGGAGAPRRAPMDLGRGRRLSDEDFRELEQGLEREGVFELVERLLKRTTGAHRKLPTRAFVLAFAANGASTSHRVRVADAVRSLVAMSDEQRAQLGLPSLNKRGLYCRVWRMWDALGKQLEHDEPLAEAVRSAVARAGIDERLPTSRTLTVDGTDIESWANVHFDGEVDPETGEWKGQVRCADPDARRGHRSATDRRPAGEYDGYEIQPCIQTRDATGKYGATDTNIGPEVPHVVRSFAVIPAGTHRNRTVVPTLLAEKRRNPSLTRIVWDRGHSQLDPGTWAEPLSNAGIEVLIDLKVTERAARPFGDAIVVDGRLFSRLMPERLWNLPMPGRHVSNEVKEQYEREFNERESWSYVRHSRPDATGTSRWKCPFHAGKLRSRQLPFTMRNSRRAPLVELEPGTKCCSQQTLSVSVKELPREQPYPFGTTAWRKAKGSRAASESVNGALKGDFVNIQARGFHRVMRRHKLELLLAFTFLGYNMYRCRSYAAKWPPPLTT